MQDRGPKNYRSIEEFQREEIRPGVKAGWSLEDLYEEAQFRPGDDESIDRGAPEELNFDE